MKTEELVKYWLKSYKKTKAIGIEDIEKDKEILLLNEDEFLDFVDEINDIEALRNLCTFLKGALDERREQFFMLEERVKKRLEDIKKLQEKLWSEYGVDLNPIVDGWYDALKWVLEEEEK